MIKSYATSIGSEQPARASNKIRSFFRLIHNSWFIRNLHTRARLFMSTIPRSQNLFQTTDISKLIFWSQKIYFDIPLGTLYGYDMRHYDKQPLQGRTNRLSFRNIYTPRVIGI